MTRILGLDYGDKKVGVAVSDLLGITAQSLTIIFFKNEKELIEKIKAIVDERKIEKIVVGLPKNMNGSIGFRGEKTLKFVEALKEEFKETDVLTLDERLSTVSSKNLMIETGVKQKDKKKKEDKIAASFILQTFLDSNRERLSTNQLP